MLHLRLLVLKLSLVVSVISFLGSLEFAGAATPVADVPFAQEYHQAYSLGEADEANDVRAVVVDSEDNVWAATRAGIHRLEHGQNAWKQVADLGPTFGIAIDQSGTVWVATWNGVRVFHQGSFLQVDEIESPISTLCVADGKLYALGPRGHWVIDNGKAKLIEILSARSIRSAIAAREGGIYLATNMGLYQQAEEKEKVGYRYRDQLISADVSDALYTKDGSLWVAGLGGVTVLKGGKATAKYDGDVLSSIDVRCLEEAPDGRIWVGTSLGVMRYDKTTWSLRHSRRWLVNDDIRDIAFDSQGNAWVATAGGVSAIKTKQITLAEKAEHFDKICQARHVRAPGIVEKCYLKTAGDVSSWEPMDDDNDGQYTSFYLVMESFRYGATKDPQAKANAKRAFEALKLLQTVTETPGFVARTVIPSDWERMKDPNHTYTEVELAERFVDDPRSKYVPVRWHPSADGKWLWKGDTSSDEITGHYFGFLFYHDLVADEAEKKRVANHVRNITDYIIAGGYNLRGLDGKHTRWGVWSPEKLNHDPDWAMDRTTNSTELLSYMKVTYHMTGDEKYQQHYLDLINKHGYAENARRSKTMDPAWRTHIDDELLAAAYPALLFYETDPELRKIYLESVERWYAATQEDRGPFCNFLYRKMTGKETDMDEAMFFLRDASLDLIRWRMDNSVREDIQVTHYPELEMSQTSRLPAISEIAFSRWDRNPWQAVQGDGGQSESDGVFWMLPYWMGRYYGFIDAP